MTTAIVVTQPAIPAEPVTIVGGRVGSDWLLQASIVNLGTPASDGSIPTTPFDLTGCTVAGTLYTPFPAPLSGGNGSLAISDPTIGAVLVTVARSVTALLPPQVAPVGTTQVRLSIALTDTAGHVTILDPIAVLPLAPSSDIPVPTSFQIELAGGVQGPSGPPGPSAGQLNAAVAAYFAAAQVANLISIGVI